MLGTVLDRTFEAPSRPKSCSVQTVDRTVTNFG